MELSVSKPIMDKTDAKKGVIRFAEDVIHEKMKETNKWNFPIDVREACRLFDCRIVTLSNLLCPDEQPSFNNVDQKIIFLNADWIKKQKHQFYVDCEIATQLQFILRNMNTALMKREEELYVSGLKIGKHILMPIPEVLRICRDANTEEEAWNTLKGIFCKNNTIPEDELLAYVKKMCRKNGVKHFIKD